MKCLDAGSTPATSTRSTMRKTCPVCDKELVMIYKPFPIEQDCWVHVDTGLEQCRIEDIDLAVSDWESEGGRAL